MGGRGGACEARPRRGRRPQPDNLARCDHGPAHGRYHLRTIFSRSLDDGIAREVFVDFATFEQAWRNVRSRGWAASRASLRQGAAARRGAFACRRSSGGISAGCWTSGSPQGRAGPTSRQRSSPRGIRDGAELLARGADRPARRFSSWPATRRRRAFSPGPFSC